MRNFMIDVWVWTKGKHSRLLKTIRLELDHFPSNDECDKELSKDEDVQFYLQQGAEVSYNNLREYNA